MAQHLEKQVHVIQLRRGALDGLVVKFLRDWFHTECLIDKNWDETTDLLTILTLKLKLSQPSYDYVGACTLLLRAEGMRFNIQAVCLLSAPAVLWLELAVFDDAQTCVESTTSLALTCR